jgi:hypothetical protein
MLVIGEAVVEDDVVLSRFCCDLDVCKGACCCIEGGRGAPLEDDEVLEVEKAFIHARRYLPAEHLDRIASAGLWEGTPGDYVTPCLDNRACVFVYYEQGIAHCSFERAFLEGDTDWRKPLSCHLFPIRVRRFGSGHLRYEQIGECAGGRRRGEQEDIPLTEFLRDPLVRSFGAAWYRQLLRNTELHGKGPS